MQIKRIISQENACPESAHSLQLQHLPKGSWWACFHVGDDFESRELSYIAVDVLPETKTARIWYFFLGEGGMQCVCDPKNLAWIYEDEYWFVTRDINRCPCKLCLEKKAGTPQ